MSGTAGWIYLCVMGALGLAVLVGLGFSGTARSARKPRRRPAVRMPRRASRIQDTSGEFRPWELTEWR